MSDLLLLLFLLSNLALIVGLIKPGVVLSWLPEAKRNRAYVGCIFGGIALLSMIWVGFPSLFENLFFVLFFLSILVLFVGLINPRFVLAKAPEAIRTRLHILMIFGAVAILSLALGSGSASLIEENADSSEQVEQEVEETSVVMAEEETGSEAEEEAKAKEEVEARAKAEEEAKAKEEAEAKAKAEKEAKAKEEAEAKKKEEEEAKKNTETVSQGQAVRKAESYLGFTAFSKSGLVDQLEFEGFSNQDATYAVEKIEVDWNEQAVKKAESYLEFTAFSRSGLIDQLKFEGFTTEQATYAVNQVGL